jgi:hypothetical protein
MRKRFRDLFQQFTHALRIAISQIGNLFYDSYTGLKKKRVVVAALSCVVFTACVIAAARLVPDVFSSDPETTDLQGDPQYDPGVSGPGNTSVPRPEGDTGKGDTPEFVPAARYTSPTPTEVEDELPERWSRPVFGDLEASGGIPDGATTDEGITPSPSSKYEVSDPARLRSVVLKTVEKINGNYLLSMDTALESGDWKSFVSDMVLVLSDVPLIGERVRGTLGSASRDAWEELEPALTRLREELYACETAEDAREVAGGEARLNAVELSGRFYSALEAEAGIAPTPVG